ncbi:hypothetical protein PACTADRAFT_46498 [Pachysolen tannophilus NRRL Y-2460]|uniref:Elongator complex protein 2 n=1 Tax=Pachysolen tannophilus NRRL Y-2460 TaxID=669874 RepID=A0A1E4TN03_PACTA|nr:hypothetical protein PACTADRAFT_46498 [Pachysolen tannophilus NRRL Y-2460]
MVEVESIVVGCNRQLQISDYNDRLQLVAFGSNNTISIWNPFGNYRGVLATLKKHTKNVIAVKWIPDSNFLLSTSEDSTVNIWEFTGGFEFNQGSNFKLIKTLTDHTHSVTCISVVKNYKIFSTGDSNGDIIIWALNESNEVEKLKTFKVKTGFYPLALAMEHLEKNSFVLTVGGTDTFLHVYAFAYDGERLLSFNRGAALHGHEDWIKAIAFKKESADNWLIASGSQDRYIRLWKLRINDAIDNSDEDSSKLTLLSNKQYKFDVEQESSKVAINFDAIIMGHDDWISSLIWHPTKLQLLSSSSDTSVMLWEPDSISGIWISKVRLGELSIKGASTATGASGGFWSGLWIFNEGKEYILTNGKTGSFRCWVNNTTEDDIIWDQELAVTGSIKPVTDLSWSENGDYLLVTSLDQTTRLFAKWLHGKFSSWHEFARPQIHGYDMICIATISNTRFISGADEKILRSFEEPKSISLMLEKLCGIKKENTEGMAQSASLPVLGLSNKAENISSTSNGEHKLADKGEDSIDGAERQNLEDDEDHENVAYDVISSLEKPPLEDILQRHTLFPEIEKLYGHGYEITTVATSPDKKLIASACRSNSAQHAIIRIFSCDTWQQLQILKGHNLTITRLVFSPNNKYLLSVSRDRQFSLWKRNFTEEDPQGLNLELVTLQEKAHSRILWDCCWPPSSYSENMFFTSSRDKSVKMWETTPEGTSSLAQLKLTDAVTSIASLPYTVFNKVILAIGFEKGDIAIYSVDENKEFKLLQSFHSDIVPDGRINRLGFSTVTSKILLACASDDCSLRIFGLDKEELI